MRKVKVRKEHTSLDDKKFYRQQKECLEMLLKSILN